MKEIQSHGQAKKTLSNTHTEAVQLEEVWGKSKPTKTHEHTTPHRHRGSPTHPTDMPFIVGVHAASWSHHLPDRHGLLGHQTVPVHTQDLVQIILLHLHPLRYAAPATATVRPGEGQITKVVVAVVAAFSRRKFPCGRPWLMRQLDTGWVLCDGGVAGHAVAATEDRKMMMMIMFM